MFFFYTFTFFVGFILIVSMIYSIQGEILEPTTINSSASLSLNSEFTKMSVEDKMKKLGIVPYIIPELPKDIINVAFKYYLRSVYLHDKGDDRIPYHRLSKLPTLYWMDCDPQKYYSLLMTHINVTNQNSASGYFEPEDLLNATQYHNMLYTNIAYCNLHHGDEIFTYEPPSSTRDTETSIYLFSLMEQTNGKVFMGFKEKYNNYFFRDQKHHNSYRSNFTVKEFMDHFETDLVAGNYMRVITRPEEKSYMQKYFLFEYFATFSNRLKNLF